MSPVSRARPPGTRVLHVSSLLLRRLARTIAFAAALACAAAGAQAATKPAAPKAEAERLTAVARLLAGIDPGSADPAFERVTQSPSWQAHRKASRAGIRQLRARLAKMNAWQGEHLPQPDGPGSTLLYPFSGPDFVNAFALFPGYERYVFFSLEPPGEVPALETLDDQQLSDLCGDLRSALNDLVALNFFITPNMKERLQTDALQGTVPVLLAMMGLLDLRVEHIAPLDPWPDRTAEYARPDTRHPDLPLKGVQIDFTDAATHRRHSLLYLSLDVSDGPLKFYPGFVPWLQSYRHPAVLLKSASYLLHGGNFRKVRTVIRDQAELIVQDDTGMPFKMLRDAGYDIELFGQYEQPVKLFENRYQKDLDDAFAAVANPEPLPFPFGYNWRKEGKSGLIVARHPRSGR